MPAVNRKSILILSLVPLLAGPAKVRAAMEFNRDIRPILTSHCTSCHGGVKSAGGVSFVYREQALGKGKSGAVIIVPGQPGESEIMARIVSTDPEEVMPKPEHGPPLKPAEVERVRQWISEGAAWSEHWSLVPPVAAAVPEVKDKNWGRVDWDAFVKARLEAEGIEASPEAGPAEWLRRVSLDLIGLPPSLEEFADYQKALAADPRAAKAAVVDRLLASPAYGERWATVWLDLARYADTYGYEKDPHRDIWPWRDWVIRALNEDMPFDQFTIKQLAGDQLPGATSDDLLATAFHRNTQNNTEGGTNDEEFRTVAIVDRVNTTWTTWQATTFGCVQCHAHPYDPYPHADYYKFMSFFDSSEDVDLDNEFPRFPVASNSADRDGLAAQWKESRELRRALNDEGVAMAAKDVSWQILKPVSAKASGGTLTIGDEGRVTAGGTLPVGVVHTLETQAVAGMTALRLKIFPDKDDPLSWPERASVLSHLTLSSVAADGAKTEVKLKEVVADYLAGPFDPQESLDGGPGGFGSYPAQAGGRWCVVILEKPLAAAEGGKLEITMKQGAVSNAGQQASTLRNFTWESSTAPQWAAWAADPARAEKWAALSEIKAAISKVPATSVPVMLERSTPAERDTRVWVRGNRLTKSDAVQPAVPERLGPPEIQGRMSRLDMARWLVGGKNPLAARVLANRLWAGMFGRGIVETLEDFGSSGALPTHPELLDFIAVRLSGADAWSMKKFLREIALSATYAQTCRTTAEAVSRDPGNALLGRGPRQRLTAEMVRDHGLRIAGLLSGKVGGPPVYPPQPDGVWSSVYSGESWKTSEGEDRYRRGVYTYVKRTGGYPGFLSFDAPARDLCSARRLPTNTPLQALVTLNDPAYLEMAAALAARVEKEGGTALEQITRACRLITLEEPPAELAGALSRLHAASLEDGRARAEAGGKSDVTPERAAMILVANTLLNTDLALNR
ncbi:MAG: hypothetical protein JWL81_2099 [Verrucomicrobiales bacterium]|nr:hypothetical protein [Verrucomicrobiales bacterium]